MPNHTIDKLLEEVPEAKIVDLKHAIRLNGIVDVWKKRPLIFIIRKNEYRQIANDKLLIATVKELLQTEKEQEPFQPLATGRMSYQQFKYANKTDCNAETYHWNLNIDKTSEDHLYFAVLKDVVKIGRSKDPKTRINSMSTGFPELPTVYVFNNKGFMEPILHRAFDKLRKHGEWFRNGLQTEYEHYILHGTKVT